MKGRGRWPVTLSLALVAACAPRSRPELGPAAASASAFALPPVPGAPAGVTAFTNVGVLTMEYEMVLPAQTVLVEGGRISALGPASSVLVPAAARRIDGSGKVLIPGLADCHAHFAGAGAMSGFLHSFADSVMVQHRLFLWLASGMTTIRNMDHGDRFPLGGNRVLLQIRDRAAAGQLWSPRIYTAGVLSGPDKGHLLPRDVVPMLTAYKAAGFDFVKIHSAFGHGDVYDSLVATAHRLGLPIEGHINGVTTVERALKDYTSIEHLTGYDDEIYVTDSAGNVIRDSNGRGRVDPARIQALAQATARAGVWNCATQYNETINAGSGGTLDTQYLDRHRQMLKALQDAGARLLLGTDRTSMPREPHDWSRHWLQSKMTGDEMLDNIYGDGNAVHKELQAMVAAGLTPYQALLTGTRNIAAFFGTLDEGGTIALGKRADMLLVDGNPLDDIRNTEHPAGVMIGGRWLDRAEIDRRTKAIKVWLVTHCSSLAVGFGQKLSC